MTKNFLKNVIQTMQTEKLSCMCKTQKTIKELIFSKIKKLINDPITVLETHNF